MMAAQKHNFGEKWVGLVRKARKNFARLAERADSSVTGYFMVIGAFIAIQKDYFYARNLYLPYVFEHRQGISVTLGAICGVCIYG